MGDYDLKIEELRFLFDNEKRLIKNPLSILDDLMVSYYYYSGMQDKIVYYPELEDIRLFFLSFHGHRKNERTRTRLSEWDSIYKYEIIDALTLPNYEWYFAIDGYIYEKNQQCRYDLHVDLEADLKIIGAYREIRITEYLNDSFWFRKLFRIDSSICKEIILKYFQLPSNIWPIEGILVPKNEKNEINQYNNRSRDSKFLIDHLERYPIVFFSLRDSHEDLCFITQNLSLEQFKQTINFNAIQRAIRAIG
jgi:hypothetical protein